MSVTQLRDGDYRLDGSGGFAVSQGAEEVLERVLFQLTARRGAFPLLPQVGSRLYLLLREKPSRRDSMGASYAAEALADEEEVQVTGAVWNEAARHLEVELLWRGERLRAAVPL